MELNNIRIKKDITLSDKIKVIESIVSSYFTNGIYTPYYAEQAKVIAIAYNFLEGITFDDDDRVYDLVNSDEKLSSLIDKFLKPQTTKIGQKYNTIMDEIMVAVKDKIDFEKQRMIHNTDAFAIVGDMCTALADVLNNFGNISQIMTPENIEAPIEKDSVVGNFSIYLDGKKLFSEDVYAMEEVKSVDFFDNIKEIGNKPWQ